MIMSYRTEKARSEMVTREIMRRKMVKTYRLERKGKNKLCEEDISITRQG